MDKLQKEEILNLKQAFYILWERLKKQTSTFIIGIVTGIIGSLIVWWIQVKCK